MYIEETFDSRTLANMNVALNRVCDAVADGENHLVRKRIARRIIKCARSGKVTLGELTAAGRRGVPRAVAVRRRVATQPESTAVMAEV